MGWSRSTADPTLDPVARKVIAAFEAAEKDGFETSQCYMAGVDIWRLAHPDHRAEYASMQAVEVILKAKIKVRVPG